MIHVLNIRPPLDAVHMMLVVAARSVIGTSKTGSSD